MIVLIGILIPTTAGLLLYSTCTDDTELMLVALILMGTIALATISQWALSTRARCPLCHTRPIASNKCSRHRSAKTMLGSYRLRTACTILFRNRFRCPYCGESTEMRSRTRRRYC